MDKNNQTSEEIVVSKSMSIMAFWVVLLTSLSWIGAFMLQRKETAIKMLLIQIVLVVAYGCHVFLFVSMYDLGVESFIGAIFSTALSLSWLCVWLWGLILTGKVALANNVLNVKDIDKNNQTSEEIVISKRTSTMAFWVVLLTSLSWIGAFMLQRKKTAIVMLLIQIVLVACGYYIIISVNKTSDSGGFISNEFVIFAAFILFLFPFWLCVWSWGLNLTGKVALAHNGLTVLARRTIKITTSLVSLLTIICIPFLLWYTIVAGLEWLF